MGICHWRGRKLGALPQKYCPKQKDKAAEQGMGGFEEIYQYLHLALANCKE
jgi:hypothetical protein